MGECGCATNERLGSAGKKSRNHDSQIRRPSDRDDIGISGLRPLKTLNLKDCYFGRIPLPPQQGRIAVKHHRCPRGDAGKTSFVSGKPCSMRYSSGKFNPFSENNSEERPANGSKKSTRDWLCSLFLCY